jgi:hypothetical protein
MNSELLIPEEVDRLLRFPTGRTARLIRKGLLPAVRLPDGSVRVRAAELHEWIDQHRIQPSEPGAAQSASHGTTVTDSRIATATGGDG